MSSKLSQLLGLGIFSSVISAAAFAEPPVQPGETLESLSKAKITTTINGQQGSIESLVNSGQVRLVNPAMSTPASAPEQSGQPAAEQQSMPHMQHPMPHHPLSNQPMPAHAEMGAPEAPVTEMTAPEAPVAEAAASSAAPMAEMAAPEAPVAEAAAPETIPSPVNLETEPAVNPEQPAVNPEQELSMEAAIESAMPEQQAAAPTADVMNEQNEIAVQAETDTAVDASLNALPEMPAAEVTEQ